MNNIIFIDGDFPTDTKCKYHCSPSCHPAQIGPDWVYGCTHIAWEQNQHHDFCPIVKCNGNPEQCEVERYKFTKSEEREIFGAKQPNKGGCNNVYQEE